jgi:hypothetical protein
MVDEIAYWVVLSGLACVLLGAVVNCFPRSLAWFGRLPGDFALQVKGRRIVLPFFSLFLFAVLVYATALFIEPYVVRRAGVTIEG